MRSLIFCICVWFSSASILYADHASFDCNKASTETEKAICADPELSALDDIVLSANKRYAITNIHSRCSATLFDIQEQKLVIEGPTYSHRECFTYAGFSSDSSIWYVYDQNALGVSIYKIDGSFVGYYEVASDPYLDRVEFSKNNQLITLHFDNGLRQFVIDISADF